MIEAGILPKEEKKPKTKQVPRIHNKQVPTSTAGIGCKETNVTSDVIHPESIDRAYITGLPSDFTDKDVEIIFSVCGKIKRIKIYVDQDGRNKGDALITFAKYESVLLACSKVRLYLGSQS